MRTFFIISLALISISAFSQNLSSDSVYSDSSLTNASVSLCVADAETGELIIDYNSGISLIPASVQKVITSSAALELLGPDYTFSTTVGYAGSLNKRGRLKGNIIIRGGGDPTLGSAYFSEHYAGFMDNWIAEIKKLGIKRIKGCVIADDSYFDFQPVPARWLWEDAGNYYGAGVYGLSVFDNTYEIHLRTFSEGFPPTVTSVFPEECNAELSNYLLSSGTKDEGYIFAAPYSNSGWIAGTVPADQQDFVLKASIPDPPLFVARVMSRKLMESGVKISGSPSTTRLYKAVTPGKVTPVTETVSPALSEIIEVLNHESVNLIAEHLTKELGKKFKNTGSTDAGIEVINEWLKTAGINTNGIFLEDGSGLSPLNAINTREMVRLLVYMRKKGHYFNDFLSSLPMAGKDGTLANSFKDPVFESRLMAKSGSMTRVRSFAGYFTTKSGKNMVFSIIINNYSGPSRVIISGIEDNIKELIIKN